MLNLECIIPVIKISFKNRFLEFFLEKMGSLDSTKYFVRIFRPSKERTRKRNSVGIYIFKVNNRNTRTRFEICSKLTIKTVSTVNFEKVNAGCEVTLLESQTIASNND